LLPYSGRDFSLLGFFLRTWLPSANAKAARPSHESIPKQNHIPPAFRTLHERFELAARSSDFYSCAQ